MLPFAGQRAGIEISCQSYHKRKQDAQKGVDDSRSGIKAGRPAMPTKRVGTGSAVGRRIFRHPPLNRSVTLPQHPVRPSNAWASTRGKRGAATATE